MDNWKYDDRPYIQRLGRESLGVAVCPKCGSAQFHSMPGSIRRTDPSRGGKVVDADLKSHMCERDKCDGIVECGYSCQPKVEVEK